MNIKTAKKPPKRFDVSYVSRFRMQSYGNDNLYPQNIQQLTAASGTAKLCISRYAKFIEGYGFDSEILAALVLNHGGSTADDILHDVANDLANFGGFALHVNYNVLGEVVEVHHVPFENCRLGEADDKGYISNILVHPDWTQSKTRNGRRLLVNENTVERFDVFNPDAVPLQIARDGGIDAYRGQIMWCSIAGNGVYPLAPCDAVITDISTDEGLGNIKYRNVRNGFLVSCMMITKKSSPYIDDDGNEKEQHMIGADDLRDFQGDEKSGKIMLVELENDEDKPEVVAFPMRNFDKEFTTTETSVVERIYAQYHQELFYAIRIGKLGFSGQVMRDAYEYYAGEVTNEQRFIERAFKAILDVWVDKNMRNIDCVLQPLKYITSEVADNNTIANE